MAVKPAGSGDFFHLAETSNLDLVLVEGEEHLREILSEDIEAWRIFLHPYQRKLVSWEVSGPMKVYGAAGTGKTVALMDELQDFGLEALRLIRALSPIAEGLNNPLCVVGDGHQRIYNRTPIPLGRAGIDVRGRSRRLKINYRTSEQISRWAQGLLDGLTIDDLDGGVADTTGDRSVFRGPEPQIVKYTTALEAARSVTAWVKGLLAVGLGTHEICIVPPDANVIGALDAVGIPTLEIKPRQQDPGQDEPGVRYGTKKRIKGLEFKAIALLYNEVESDDVGGRFANYVAATIARQNLLMVIPSDRGNGCRANRELAPPR